jgi:hypothetical protein
VFLQEDSTRYPIPGLPVEFVLLTGKASFNPHTQTDAQGQAFCQVQEISSPGRVELEAGEFSGGVLNRPKDSAADSPAGK